MLNISNNHHIFVKNTFLVSMKCLVFRRNKHKYSNRIFWWWWLFSKHDFKFLWIKKSNIPYTCKKHGKKRNFKKLIHLLVFSPSALLSISLGRMRPSWLHLTWSFSRKKIVFFLRHFLMEWKTMPCVNMYCLVQLILFFFFFKILRSFCFSRKKKPLKVSVVSSMNYFSQAFRL